MSDHRLLRGLRLLPLLAALAALAACAPAVRETAPPLQPAPQAPADGRKHEAAAVAETTNQASAEAPRQDEGTQSRAATAPTPTLWQALVDRHAFVECEEPGAAVRRWQKIYLQSPRRHGEQLATIEPWIAYVAEELERRSLPSEFVWLPFVESRYHPFRTRGDRPAGVWQMMPATARWRGLRIEPGYDGRLDFVAATDAALDLIEHLAEVFDGDWALVTMAYNAGEYRIRGALDKARRSGKSVAPEQLAVSPITHEHLVKLRALACSITDPARFALVLPPFDKSQELLPLQLPRAVAVQRLTQMLGVEMRQWLEWNPAWRDGHLPADATILLPRALHAAHAPAIAALPESSAPAATSAASAAPTVDGEHVVVAGESAWSIARRHGIALAELLALNGLDRRSILRPGQRLRLR